MAITPAPYDPGTYSENFGEEVPAQAPEVTQPVPQTPNKPEIQPTPAVEKSGPVMESGAAAEDAAYLAKQNPNLNQLQVAQQGLQQQTQDLSVFQQMFSPTQPQAAVTANPEDLDVFRQMYTAGDPLPVKTPTAPKGKSPQLAAQEQRERDLNKPQAPWEAGWNVPHEKKLAKLIPKASSSDVKLNELKEPVLAGLYDLNQLAERKGYELVIESGKRTKKPGATNDSYHYHGEAVDVNFRKNGKDVTYTPQAVKLFKNWAAQAGFASMIDEANHPIPGVTQGPHFHLAWGNDGGDRPGAYHMFQRSPSDPNYLAPHKGLAAKNIKSFADAQPLLEKQDLKTIPGKTMFMAETHGLNNKIFYNMIARESEFNPNAVSSAGAKGPGQIMPETAQYLAGKYNMNKDAILNDPTTNLRASALYLKENLNNFGGNYARALAAYNMGPGALNNYLNGKGPLYNETRDYVYSILKDTDPNLVRTPKDVDAILKNNGGPTYNPQTKRQLTEQEARAVQTPMQNVVSRLKDIKDVTVDTGSGVLDDLHNMTATFLNGASFNWLPDWRKEARVDKENIVAGLMDNNPYLKGLRYTSTELLPWVAGIAVSWNKLLGGAQVATKALASRVPALGFMSEAMGAAAASEVGTTPPLISRYLNNVLGSNFGGVASKLAGGDFLKATVALGSVLAMDGAGRSMADWFHASRKGETDKDFNWAVQNSLKTGFWQGTIGTALSMAIPFGGQMAASTMVRSPETANAISQLLTHSDPTTAALKRGVVGAGVGLAGSTAGNLLASVLGYNEQTFNPALATGVGALLGAGGKPFLDKALKVSDEAGIGFKSPAFQAFSKRFDELWTKFDDSYKNTFTQTVLEATENVEKQQKAVQRKATKDAYVKSLEENASYMEPKMQGPAKHIEAKSLELSKLQEQTTQTKTQLDLATKKAPPGMMQNVDDFEKNSQELKQIDAKRKELTQQRDNFNAQGNDKAAKSVGNALNQIKAQSDELTAKNLELTKANPQIPAYVELRNRAEAMAKKFEMEGGKIQEELSTITPAVTKANEWIQGLKAEAERVKAIPDEFMDDPSFRLSTGSKLSEIEYNPSDMPEYFPGMDKDEITRVYNATFKNGVQSLIDEFDVYGRNFDKNLFLQGKKLAGDATAGYSKNASHDAMLDDSIVSYQQKAKLKTEMFKNELYDGNVYVTGTARKPILNKQSIKYEIPKKTKFGAMHVDVALDIAKKQGYDLESPTIKALAQKYQHDGIQSAFNPDIAKPKMKELTVSGTQVLETKKGGKVSYKEFSVNEDITAQALAAQQIGDTHIPVSYPKGSEQDFKHWADAGANSQIEDMKAFYSKTGDDLKKYAEEMHSQEILSNLNGLPKDDQFGGEIILNQVLSPEHVNKRLHKKVHKLVTGQDLIPGEDAGVSIPIEDYFQAAIVANPENKKLLEQMISEDIQLIGQIGKDIVGVGPQGQKIKGLSPMEQISKESWLAKDERGTYVTDEKGVVKYKKQNFVVSGTTRQRLAMSLPEDMSSPDLMKSLQMLRDKDSLAFFNNERVMYKAVENEVKTIAEAGGLTHEDVAGHTLQSWGKNVDSYRNTLNEIADNTGLALNDTVNLSYDMLAKDIKQSHTKGDFVRDAIDAIEDFSKYKEFVDKYGEVGRGALSSTLSVMDAMSKWKGSSEFMKKFMANSYMLHSFPLTIDAMKATRILSESPGEAFTNSIGDVRRRVKTMAEARRLNEAAEAAVETAGVSPKMFLQLSPDERARYLNKSLNWPDVEPTRKAKLIEEANIHANNLLLKVDYENLNVGDLLSNRLKAMGHAESSRRLISYMMDTPVMNIADNLNPTKLIRKLDEKEQAPKFALKHTKEEATYQRLDSIPLFHGIRDIKVKGEDIPISKLQIHPEAARILNDYVGQPNLGSFKKVMDFMTKVNRETSSITLLGSFIPFMLTTSVSTMGQMVGSFFKALDPQMLNMSGAGRKIRTGDRGKLLELFAYRTGLNGRNLMSNTVDITNDTMHLLGPDIANSLYGISNSKTTNFLASLDPRNPNRALAYKQLTPIWKRASDVMSVPLEVEQAFMKHMLYSHIRDAQLAAHFVRANQFLQMSPDIFKIQDPIRRLVVANESAAQLSNKDVGGMPYYIFNKNFRTVAGATFLTPGWSMSIAHTILDGLSGVLGLGNQLIGKASPGTAEYLNTLGRKLVGGKPLYAHIDPSLRNYVRNRMAKNIGGLVIASTMFTELFNTMVNGQTSFSDPDVNQWGKMRVGSTYYTNPLFGYVKKISKLFYAGTGEIIAKAKGNPVEEEFHTILFDQIRSMMSPFAQQLSNMAAPTTGSRQAQIENIQTQDEGVIGHLAKTGLQLGSKVLGGNELLGFRRDADPKNMLPWNWNTDESKASRLPPAQHILRSGFGIYDTERNIPSILRGKVERIESVYRDKLQAQVENYLKAAQATNDPEMKNQMFAKAEIMAKRGVEVNHPQLKKYLPVVRMTPEQFYSARAKITNPMSIAMKGTSPVDQAMMRDSINKYDSAGMNIYDSLAPGDELEEDDE